MVETINHKETKFICNVCIYIQFICSEDSNDYINSINNVMTHIKYICPKTKI